MSTDLSLERAAVDRVSQLLNREIGLRTEPTLRGRLERCIRDDAAISGLSVDSYADTLAGGGSALQNLVNRVTVQETAFFRHPEHFELLASGILQRLTQPVTIWSAACSNGQEAYSLAMLLEELDIPGSIVASDLSTVAVERTITATYSERELLGLTPQRIARHLDRREDGYHVKQRVRARVTALHVNLFDPIPSDFHACQIVFCRNVLIYFSPEHARSFLERVGRALPEATLFLGAAESIWQLSDQYDTVRTGDTFTYRRHRPATAMDGQRKRIPPRTPAPFRTAATGRPGDARSVNGPTTASGAANLSRASAVRQPRESARIGPHDDSGSASAALALAGQQASAAGDVSAAVVAFRKCAYLNPRDPMAHLHLGLALETAGDQPSAQRAYAAARDAVSHTEDTRIEQDTEGYTTEDLLRFIHHKQQVVKP